MGQEAVRPNQNILVFGINHVLDMKLLTSEWQKVTNYQTYDFAIYKKVNIIPQQLLWCPINKEIQQLSVQSIILNIEFEGVLYVFEEDDNEIINSKKMIEHRKLIKWLMSEEAMRQCSLIIIYISKSDKEYETIKNQTEVELDLESMDSKQARNLIISQVEKENNIDLKKIVSQIIKMKKDS